MIGCYIMKNVSSALAANSPSPALGTGGQTQPDKSRAAGRCVRTDLILDLHDSNIECNQFKKTPYDFLMEEAAAGPKFSPENALDGGEEEYRCRRLEQIRGVSGLVCTLSSFGSFLSRKEQAE